MLYVGRSHLWNQLPMEKCQAISWIPHGLWHQKFYHRCLRTFLFLLFFPTRLAFWRARVYLFIFCWPNIYENIAWYINICWTNFNTSNSIYEKHSTLRSVLCDHNAAEESKAMAACLHETQERKKHFQGITTKQESLSASYPGINKKRARCVSCGALRVDFEWLLLKMFSDYQYVLIGHPLKWTHFLGKRLSIKAL